jgi:hypothetical protein
MRWKKFFIIFMLTLALTYGELLAQPVTRDLIVKYDFTEKSGTVIHDRVTAIPGQYLDLIIPDESKVEWLDPGLRVKEAMVVLTTAARTKLAASQFFTKGITIEVWVKPLNNTQSGPARIVTFSQDSGERNFTLGQSAHFYEQRFRTSETNPNGSDIALTTPVTSIASTPVLQHVVYTRNAAGTANFYINKLKVQALPIPGNGSVWNNNYDFGLFNETNYPTDTRTWLGDIFLVAIYATTFTAEEVAQNYDAGVPKKAVLGSGEITLAWDANTEPDLAGYTIYWGLVSRGTNKLEQINKWCAANEPSNEKCVEEWQAICPEPLDKACHSMLYEYDDKVDMENVPRTTTCPEPYDPFKLECCEVTLTGFEKGKTYYFAATAYDEEDPPNESAYSEELDHTFVGKPTVTRPQNLREP